MTPDECAALFTKNCIGLLSKPTVEPDGCDYQRTIIPLATANVEFEVDRLYSPGLLHSLFLGYACARAHAKRLRGILNIVFPEALQYDLEAFARLVVALEEYAGTPSKVFSAKWLVEERREGWSSKTPSSVTQDIGTIVITRLHDVLTNPFSLRVITEVMALVNIYEQGVILLTHKPIDEYAELEYKGNLYHPTECLDVGHIVEIRDILSQVR